MHKCNSEIMPGKRIRNEKMHEADKDLEYFTSLHFHVWL